MFEHYKDCLHSGGGWVDYPNTGIKSQRPLKWLLWNGGGVHQIIAWSLHTLHFLLNSPFILSLYLKPYTLVHWKYLFLPLQIFSFIKIDGASINNKCRTTAEFKWNDLSFSNYYGGYCGKLVLKDSMLCSQVFLCWNLCHWILTKF